jgi:cytidylate kinase
MAVITISRQVGSGGVSIGKKVAEILGYHFIDKNTLADVLKEYGMVEFEKVYDFSESFWDRFAPSRNRMVMMMNQSIKAIASHDNAVILGRGSYVVLGGFSNVLNVRIQAPLDYRVRRVMEQENIPDFDRAETIVKTRDKIRVDFVEFTYGVSWDKASDFDLVIDTSKVAPEKAAAWLVETVRGWHIDQEPTTDAIEVDPILERFIADKILTM